MYYLLGIAVMIVNTLIVEQNISFGSATDCGGELKQGLK